MPDDARNCKGMAMRGTGKALLIFGYQIASLATFIKLLLFDDYVYTWWNWIIAIPVDAFLAEIWPIYWLILHPIRG